ncbi:uncharacterized protein LOC108606042 [Drosophila busckii]|uniref:uncharacterized protein LOC108606042 n=1 Tax=Drosophila busckii TaxID=30019 RepID=UPI001432F86D|nr:uncharacterized protein LOC108606042 [Drosophila busckii]
MPQLLLHLLLLLLLAATTVAATTADEPEDICLHCSCNRTTVVCNFTHANKLAWVWNGNYKIPNIILAVELQLAGNTEFTLQNGTFHENRVNSFVIKGGYAGNDQVELAQYAFAGNKGGYPEIRIVDVGNVFLRANAFSGSEIKLRVENSKTLDVFPHAFINMNMTCNLINIEQLKIQKNSFSPSTDLRVKSSVILNVENCTIPLIESFDVSMNKIAFKSCTIYTVQSQAFEVTRIDEVSFENCRIEKIEANAFTNKLECGNFSITDSQIGTIEHKAINGSGITALTLRNNNIETIRGNAIEINSIDVYVEENKVKHLDAHWLHVKVADVVSIKDNRFDNYAKLQLDQTSRRANCSFANNLLGQMQAASLNFGSCEVRNITLQRGCSCDDTKHLLPALTEHDLSAEVYCQPPQRLRNCLKLRTVHMRRFGYDACGVNRTSLHCVDNSTLDCWHGDCSSKQRARASSSAATASSRLPHWSAAF